MLDCLITNGIIIPVEPKGEVFTGYVGLKNGYIALLGEGKPDPIETKKTIDASDQIIIPGFTNAHLHLSPSFLRGLISHLTIEENDIDPFVKTFYKEMNEEEAYCAARLELFECLQTGVTSAGIMEYVSLDAALNAMRDVGITGCFSIDVDSDEDDFRRYARIAESMDIEIMLSAPNEDLEDYYNETFLSELGRRAKDHDVLIHAHIQETNSRTELIRKSYGKSPIAFLADIGILPQMYAVHCTMADKDDINLLAEYGVPVILSPKAEAMVSDGIGPIKTIMDAGITIGLGTDGSAWTGTSDMFREMKAAALLYRALGHPTDVSSSQLLEMATLGGAKAMRLDDKIGSLVVGKYADITFIDTKVLHLRPLLMDPICNVLDLLVYSATGADVARVMKAGRILYQRGESGSFQGLLLDEIQVVAQGLFNRLVNKI